MFLSAQNVKPFKFMPEKHRFVSEEHYQGYVKSRKPEKGDVLLTRVGAGIGEAATIDQDLDFAIYVSLGLVRPMRGFVFSDYITLWLNSPDGTEKSRQYTYGKGVSQGNLNLSLIRNFLVPLPPLAEQRRIVAKVDELMALVDQLEAQHQELDQLAEAFAKACVASFTGTTQLE
jgi:type I restriction enzyme, S subunit